MNKLLHVYWTETVLQVLPSGLPSELPWVGCLMTQYLSVVCQLGCLQMVENLWRFLELFICADVPWSSKYSVDVYCYVVVLGGWISAQVCVWDVETTLMGSYLQNQMYFCVVLTWWKLKIAGIALWISEIFVSALLLARQDGDCWGRQNKGRTN